MIFFFFTTTFIIQPRFECLKLAIYVDEVKAVDDIKNLSLVISAFEQAGCKVKSGGATYTGNMKSVFLRYGFSDVTSKIALSTGLGLKRGDALLNTVHHTALVVEDGGKSGDQTGREI